MTDLPEGRQNCRQADGGSSREEADNYRDVIISLNPGWRVIACRGRIQWIVQSRVGVRRGQPRWTSLKFNRCKEALISNVRDLAGETDPAAWAVLDSLPDWFGGRP